MDKKQDNNFMKYALDLSNPKVQTMGVGIGGGAALGGLAGGLYGLISGNGFFNGVGKGVLLGGAAGGAVAGLDPDLINNNIIKPLKTKATGAAVDDFFKRNLDWLPDGPENWAKGKVKEYYSK
jgi:hypothetical protein